MFDNDKFTIPSTPDLTFQFKTDYDDDGTPPWERGDGFGIVSDWRPKESKLPSERILNEDHGSCRFYDWKATMEKAKREAWGLSDEEKERLTAQLGRAPTKNQIVERAVEKDFEWLRGWCKDEWQYIGVIITLLDVNGNPTPVTQSLWGIESDQDKYIEEVARELASEIVANLGDDPTRPLTRLIRTEKWIIRPEPAGARSLQLNKE